METTTLVLKHVPDSNFRLSAWIKFHEFHKWLIQLAVIERLFGQLGQALLAVAVVERWPL